MKLENKVAIITGAGSGIGRESALLFAKEGAKVVVADVNEKGGEETVASIKNNGGDSFFFKLDVTNREQSKNMVKTTMEKYGRIDVLINNAGINQDALVAKMTEEQWDRVIDINLKRIRHRLQRSGHSRFNRAGYACARIRHRLCGLRHAKLPPDGRSHPTAC